MLVDIVTSRFWSSTLLELQLPRHCCTEPPWRTGDVRSGTGSPWRTGDVRSDRGNPRRSGNAVFIKLCIYRGLRSH